MMQNWLLQAPTFTTFRVNKLKKVDTQVLEQALRFQSIDLNCHQIPTYYFLKPDCLILEQWPEETVIEKTGKEVIVDALCAAAVLRGAHVFAPGVMGLPPNYRLDEKVDIYADLDGQCKRGLKINYDGRKRFVGIGYLKMLRHELFDSGVRPSGIAVHTIIPESRLPIVNESLYQKGELLLQNLPSIICGWVVDAQPNEYILDMCAAPGNKTTHLAEMSNNHAFITALDKTQQKSDKIIKNCQQHGITCVSVYAFDSTKCCSEESAGINEGPPFPPCSFDKVLLDAPCSGLGQRPQLKNTITPKILQSYKYIQRKLFFNAVKLLKVGGKLVYSTCTITEEENERMVIWALKKFPGLQLVPAEPLLGGPGLAVEDFTDDQRVMVQRFGPERDPLRVPKDIYRDSIGFFIASFTKLS